ncbi:MULTISPECIES: HTTM domain-containing protein [unclassified Streptomyces]|uniref:HTTM domain-containing protein n=1 Tax=unclassified Streptomyces TaxID=2593676 RepID=UPI002DD89B26|nr:HTTM domain-containing protein [Streptomyces sp. NBC_01750]WSB00669.1 HTTM domain-containing protein [Streptomyces sp. NBC_01794]WSD34974.1 HTTM domain-containing protein [Streptomyces sp. NBC_01750]
MERTEQALATPTTSRRTTEPAAVRTPQRVPERVHAFLVLLTERPVSLYAAAVLRIGYGLLYLAFLLREFPHRDEMWGPGSPWTPALARQMLDQSGWFSVLTLSDSRVYFEVCYAVALVTCALFLLGWRTRAVSVLFAVVVVSFHAKAIFMADGGDNLMVLMAVYLVFTASGRRWSLDARRTRLRASVGKTAGPRGGGLRHQLGDTRDILTTVLHNCGMFVIAVQVCFLYGCAGLYKVQGPSWGNGTALHYVLNIDLFRPWPGLSQMIDGHHVLIAVAGYLTVLVQVAFPFVLFGRLKYPVLIVLLGMHVNIAVLMGLPLFSGAMIVADAAFLPDRFYRSLGRLWQRAPRPPGVTGAGASPGSAHAAVPPQPRPAG